MSRINRPLNPAAVRAADDTIYLRHASDPRPNALYDEQGGRRPLDATDPGQRALRQEWCDAYHASAAAPAADPQPAAEQVVADPVQCCPNDHHITLSLLAAPDAGARNSWWPARPPGYAGVAFSAELTNGRRNASVGSDGMVTFDGIPAGACSFDFSALYTDVESELAPA